MNRDTMKTFVKFLAAAAIITAGWTLLRWAGVLIGIGLTLALFSEE